MASGITNNPILPAPVGCPLSIEYTLELSDHLALDMFLFDTVIRKRLRFRLEFYGVNGLLWGTIGAATSGVLWWGLVKVLDPSVDPFTPRIAGYAGALIVFAATLITLLPSSFLHQRVRSANEKRFGQARRAQIRAGILRCPQRYRVVLMPEWFAETVEFHETGIAVEIAEHKETRVWWVAVTGIDMAQEHAFFSVKDKGYLILPRAAFADEASFRLFVDMARSYREAARVVPAPRPELSPPPDMRITH
jgi:hypothetical protein